MITRVRHVLVALFSALVVGLPSVASAVVISYRSVDLTDLVAGQDRWRYEYTVSGAFAAFGGFNVLFSPSLYKDLQDPPPAVNAAWSVATVEPNSDPLLLANGLYTATAQADNFSLADLFTLTFVWLGSGVPGSQPFEVFDSSFAILERGQTPALSQVPLPGTLALLCIGFLTLAVRNTLSSRQRR